MSPEAPAPNTTRTGPRRIEKRRSIDPILTPAHGTFPETIPELLAWRAARAAPGPWVVFADQAWTLRDVLDQVDRYAVGLAERGVVRGDRVAIMLGNRPETLFAW